MGRNAGHLSLVATALVALAASTFDYLPRLVWNASPSVPRGIYWIAGHNFGVGAIIAVWLPVDFAALAHERRYLDRRALLLKTVRAIEGSRVCRSGPLVSVDGRVVALARSHDAAGRPLPRWRGCATLTFDDLLVLSNMPGSFDGRYFGVLRRDAVVGQAIPLWTWNR